MEPTPIAVDIRSGRNAIQVGGHDHSCVILDNGKLKCWGTNSNGELGTGYTSDGKPKPIGAVALGSRHSCCVLLDDGTLKYWGRNTEGQLGRGYISDAEPIPIAFDVGSGSKTVQVTVGGDHSCVILDDGTSKC